MQHTKKLVIAGVLAVVLGLSGVAYALWSASGRGTGGAKAATAQQLTLVASSGAADLYPGGTGDVHFRVTNPNPYPVRFTGGSITEVLSTSPILCVDSSVVAVDPPPAFTLDVPANTTTPIAASWPDAVMMVSTARNECQGVSFTISLSLTGSQI